MESEDRQNLREVLLTMESLRRLVMAMRQRYGNEWVREVILEDFMASIDEDRLFAKQPLAYKTGDLNEMQALEVRRLIALMPVNRNVQAQLAGIGRSPWYEFLSRVSCATLPHATLERRGAGEREASSEAKPKSEEEAQAEN